MEIQALLNISNYLKVCVNYKNWSGNYLKLIPLFWLTKLFPMHQFFFFFNFVYILDRDLVTKILVVPKHGIGIIFIFS